MKNIKISLLVVFLVLTAAVSTYADGGNRNGTAGAAQLLIPVGTRGIAMGSSTLTNATGIEAIYWNPAGLVRAENATNVMFSQMNYIADIGVSYGAISTNIEGIGAIALSIKNLSMDEIATTTVEYPDGTGQLYTPEILTLGVTYSRALSDRISVGLTANYISESLDRVKASGFGFNIGIAYQNLGNVDGLSFAVAIKNLGPSMQFDGSGLFQQADAQADLRGSQYYKLVSAPFELPSTLELGLGYNFNVNAENNFQISGAFANANFYGDEYKGGMEYSYNKTLFLRGGYNYTSDINKDSRVFGLTAGAGVKYASDGFNVTFDYAYRQAQYFNANHIFSVAVGF
ncbi:MAG: PorV/PorQ family protein [Syntrophothermus sp.]